MTKVCRNVKEYRENTTLAEQKEFAAELQTWLGVYTQEVYSKVMKRMDDIIGSEYTLHLIHELHVRTQRERADEVETIMLAMGREGDLQYPLHNHPLEHAGSYRDILYDLYIAD